MIDRMGTGPSTVSVTPISPGVTRPWILLLAVVATIREVVDVVHGAGRWQPWLYAVVAGPVLVVALGRSLRWRSHKIHVHDYGVTVERGLGHRGRSSVAWADIATVEVQQSLRDRLSGRGQVVLETATGTWTLGLVRHPMALARVIESGQHHAGSNRSGRDEGDVWPASPAPRGRRHLRAEPIR
ncbi:MAG: PH domain-containing protein [Acidimicrobiales bacterium]